MTEKCWAIQAPVRIPSEKNEGSLFLFFKCIIIIQVMARPTDPEIIVTEKITRSSRFPGEGGIPFPGVGVRHMKRHQRRSRDKGVREEGGQEPLWCFHKNKWVRQVAGLGVTSLNSSVGRGTGVAGTSP